MELIESMCANWLYIKYGFIMSCKNFACTMCTVVASCSCATSSGVTVFISPSDRNSGNNTKITLLCMMTSSIGSIFGVPGDFPHKGQWRVAFMFFFICTWIKRWVNNRETGNLGRHRAHYDVIGMFSHKQFATAVHTLIHHRYFRERGKIVPILK